MVADNFPDAFGLDFGVAVDQPCFHTLFHLGLIEPLIRIGGKAHDFF